MSDFRKIIDNIPVLVYDNINDTSDGGVTMTSRELLAAALKESGKTQAEAAKSVNWVPQQLSSRLVRNSLRADEFLALLEGIGVELTLTVKDTGKTVKTHIAGAGQRVKAMVDRVIYDTAESDALANNFYEDGENKFTDGEALELYIDKEGRYFFAEYYEDETKKSRITPVAAKVAAAFIREYGTDIHKTKTE